MSFLMFKNKKKMGALVGLPLAFVLTQCAENFDAPPIPPTPAVAEEIVSGLNRPFDVVIVPDSAAAAPGKTLAHKDLLVANFGDNTIVQIDKSVEPSLIVPFAEQSDTADLKGPTGIAFDTQSVQGDIYVTNFFDETGTTVSAGAITAFDKDGSLNRVINNTLFGRARGIVYDAEHSTVNTAVFYVSNLENNTILKVDVTATTDTVVLYADMGFLGLSGLNPTQLAIDPLAPHHLYVANTGLQNNAAPIGSTITTLPTNADVLGGPLNSKDDGIDVIAAGGVSGPLSLDFDVEGRLFMAGHADGTLLMVDPDIGFRIASIETGEAEIQGMTVGDSGIYLATEGGKVIEVNKSRLTGGDDGGDDGSGHHKS